MRLCLLALLLLPSTLCADPARRDRYGDPLPEGAIQRLGTARLKHPGCQSLMVSHDGKIVVTVGGEIICLWSAVSGKLLKKYTQRALPHFQSVSRDGRRYFGTDERGFFVRDIETFRDIHRQSEPGEYSISVFVESDDPDMMATIESSTGQYSSGTVRIWDLKAGTNRKLGEVPCPSEAFFADCDHFVTIPASHFRRGSEFPPVLIWNVLQGGAASFRAGLVDRLDSTPISESHPWLVTRSPNSDLIREFWDPRSLKRVGSKLLPDPYELFRSPNGQHHLIWDGHGRYELWNRRVERKLADLGRIEYWNFSDDGKSLFTFGNSLQRIDLRTGKALWPSVVDREPLPPSGIRWCENSSRLLVGANGKDFSFAYYDLSTGQRLDTFEHPELRSIAPEERLNRRASDVINFRNSNEASIDDRVFRKNQEWVVRPNLSAIPVFEGGTRVPRNISPRGDLLVVNESVSDKNASRESDVNYQGDDGDLVIWERITGDQIFRLQQPGRGMIAFHPSERFVASVCEDGIRIWDLSNGNLVRQFDGYDFQLLDSGQPRFISFSPEGKQLASEHVDSTILIWDVCDLPALPKVRLSFEEIKRLWLLLRRGRGTEANAAIWKLAGSPETVLPFLRENLQPVREFTPKDFAALLPDLLDPINFRRRETALRKLEEMSDAVVPHLRELLEEDFDDLQLSRRLRSIVASRFWDTRPSGVELQSMRAIRQLEMIGGREALNQMENLSKGLGMSRSTIEAIAAVARMRGLDRSKLEPTGLLNPVRNAIASPILTGLSSDPALK